MLKQHKLDTSPLCCRASSIISLHNFFCQVIISYFLDLTPLPLSSLLQNTLKKNKNTELLGPVRVCNLTSLSGSSLSWDIWKLKHWQLMCWTRSKGAPPSPSMPLSFKASHRNALVISYDLSHNINSADPANENWLFHMERQQTHTQRSLHSYNTSTATCWNHMKTHSMLACYHSNAIIKFSQHESFTSKLFT